jgi:hypothetical protein
VTSVKATSLLQCALVPGTVGTAIVKNQNGVKKSDAFRAACSLIWLLIINLICGKTFITFNDEIRLCGTKSKHLALKRSDIEV